MSNTIEEHGWSAVSRSLDKLLASREAEKAPQPISPKDLELPRSALIDQVLKYAKENLPAETFNHSMRVFHYGSSFYAFLSPFK
jgi:cyanamide hydratase